MYSTKASLVLTPLVNIFLKENLFFSVRGKTVPVSYTHLGVETVYLESRIELHSLINKTLFGLREEMCIRDRIQAGLDG